MSGWGCWGSRFVRACSGSCLAGCSRGAPDGLELTGGKVVRLVGVPLVDGILRGGAERRLVVCEGSGLLGGFPFGRRGGGDGLFERSLEFNLAGDPAVGVDLEVEPGVFL